jgi:site-specific recombinase XerD
LYLDIYDSGRRTKEYLKLYLLPKRTEADKERNRKTLELAEAIKAERILNLQSNKSTFFKPIKKELKMSFADYMAHELEAMKNIRTKDYIRRYTTGETWVRRYDAKTTLKQIDKKWIQGFIHFLTVTPGKYGRLLNQNTIHEYLIYIANVLNNAVREGIIDSNPTKSLQPVDRPKKYESKREYLTDDEIKKLIEVPDTGKYNNIRSAFLFACFCGLRYSDIQQLQWKHLKQTEDGVVINKKIQKTQTMAYLPLNKKAISFLPPRSKDNDFVFNLPKSMTTIEAYIKVWSEFAGIDKHITFHTSRHSFGVNILAFGGDIYTLSKLMVHKRVTTTKIYAEVLNENKKKTAELLDEER